jgi:hypothetical protein
MQFLARFSPFRAIRDLRVFLSHRQPYELGFLALSIVITALLIAGFVKDSSIPVPYKRDIIYVQNWRADRSIAEIRAQQKIDGPIEAARKADYDRRQAAVRASFKKYDDKLTKWGL